MIALFAAAECGDAKRVDQLLNCSQDSSVSALNSTDYRSRTAMHIAVEHGHRDVVDVLIGHGIDLTAKDCGGFTALHLAAELGHDKIVARLLKESPQLAQEQAHKDLTCLHLAVIKGHVMIVRQLLAFNLQDLFGKSADEDTQLGLALEFAIDYGRDEIVALLVDVSVKSQNSSHVKTLFITAVRSGYDHIAIQLLTKTPQLMDELFEWNRSALHFTAEYGRDVVVAHMFALRPHWAEVGGNYGMSLLHFAAEYGYDKVVSELLVEKPHLIDIAGDGGRNVLHLAAQGGHDEVVAQLLAVRPALASQIDFEEQTVLHAAASGGHEKVVARLLAHNPELINAEDREGQTALYLAVQNPTFSPEKPHDKAVACLLAHRSVVDEDVLWAALDNVSDTSVDEIVTMLLAYKPELIGCVDHNGDTVLHIVFGLPYRKKELFGKELMSLVYQMSPDALDKTNFGIDTPFHVAIQNDNQFGIELVQSKLSLDAIVGAFAKCNKPCPESFFDKLGECLLESLDKDLVGAVAEYLGLESKRPNKRKEKRPRLEGQPRSERYVLI